MRDGVGGDGIFQCSYRTSCISPSTWKFGTDATAAQEDDEDGNIDADGVSGEDLPSSPSSSLSFSSSVCKVRSNCFATSATLSASPSASFVPAAKSHSGVHVCICE